MLRVVLAASVPAGLWGAVVTLAGVVLVAVWLAYLYR